MNPCSTVAFPRSTTSTPAGTVPSAVTDTILSPTTCISGFSSGFSLLPSINFPARIAIRIGACPAAKIGSNRHEISRTKTLCMRGLLMGGKLIRGSVLCASGALNHWGYSRHAKFRLGDGSWWEEIGLLPDGRQPLPYRIREELHVVRTRCADNATKFQANSFKHCRDDCVSAA